MTEHVDPMTMRRAASRALDYLSSQFDRHGRSRSNPADPALHYKLPYVLAYGGRRDQALHVLGHLENDLLSSSGCYRDDAFNGPASAYLYQAGWLMWGSVALERFDLARRLARAVIDEQDARWGGFWSDTPIGRVQWLLYSSSAMSGCAVAGEIEGAAAVAQYLRRLMDVQPRPRDVFYCSMNADGEAVVSKHDLHVFQLHGPCAPSMFATVIVGLVWLGRQTGDPSHYELARRYAHLFLANDHEPHRQPFASKSGWACLQLHRHVPDDELLRYANGIGARLIEIQLPDGSVDLSQVPGFERGVPYYNLLSVTCDWTLSAIALANGTA